MTRDGSSDCGDNSCLYAAKRGGMRTNGGCRCDACDYCGAYIRNGRTHREWCQDKTWTRERGRFWRSERCE